MRFVSVGAYFKLFMYVHEVSYVYVKLPKETLVQTEVFYVQGPDTLVQHNMLFVMLVRSPEMLHKYIYFLQEVSNCNHGEVPFYCKE